MNDKNCLPFQAEIEDAAAVNRQIGSAAKEHLAACALCTAAFSEHSRLRELIAGLEPVTAPADFDFRLRARLASAMPRKASALGWRWNAWKAPVFGLATAAALVVGGTTAFNSGLFRMTTEPGTLNAAGQIQAGVASMIWNKDEPPVVAPPVEPVNSGSVSERTVAGRRNPGIQSSEISVKGPAQTILPDGFDNTVQMNGSEFEVSGRPSGAPTRITVEERGRRRSVNVSPYSFGSQDMIIPASGRVLPPASERIW